MPNPYPSVNFFFSISLENEAHQKISFQEVSGINLQEPFKEKQLESSVVNRSLIPKKTQVDDLVLRRGTFDKNSSLYLWFHQVLQGDFAESIRVHNLLISLENEKGVPLRTWKVFNAYPIAYKLDDFKGEVDMVCFETLKFEFERIERYL